MGGVNLLRSHAGAERSARRADPAGRSQRPAEPGHAADAAVSADPGRRREGDRRVHPQRRGDDDAARGIRRPAPKRSCSTSSSATPAAGKRYFAAKCARCHSATGDLQGVAARYADPVQLQNTWVSGGGGGGRGGGRGAAAPPAAPNRRQITVTVTTASGQKVEGRLDRIDDFIVDADARRRHAAQLHAQRRRAESRDSRSARRHTASCLLCIPTKTSTT